MILNNSLFVQKSQQRLRPRTEKASTIIFSYRIFPSLKSFYTEDIIVYKSNQKILFPILKSSVTAFRYRTLINDCYFRKVIIDYIFIITCHQLLHFGLEKSSRITCSFRKSSTMSFSYWKEVDNKLFYRKVINNYLLDINIDFLYRKVINDDLSFQKRLQRFILLFSKVQKVLHFRIANSPTFCISI